MMHVFKAGDYVRVSDCCNGIIRETYEWAAMVEIDDASDKDIIYIDIDELQLIKEG